MFIPQAQPHAQSLFLFPIVFGINLIHFFDFFFTRKKNGAPGNGPFAQLLVWVREGASGDGRSVTCTWIAPRTARNGDKKSTSRPSETLKLHVGDWPTVTGCPVSNPGNNCANGLFDRLLYIAASIPCQSRHLTVRRMRTVSKSATFLATQSVNSAPFKRGKWGANFLARKSAKLFANTKVHIFGKEKCKTRRQF